MSQKLSTTIGQKLLITPELRQNIGLLSLSNEALSDEISNALEQNPFLEILNPPTDGADHYKRKLKGALNSLISMPHGNLRDTPSTSYKPLITEKRDTGERINDSPGKAGNYPDVLSENSQSLTDHLCQQLETSTISPKFQMIAFALIDAISTDGLLSEPLDTIVETLRPYLTTDLKEVENVLGVIQKYDPPGVGARNLQECFLIQLESLTDEIDYREAAQELVRDHYELLQQPNRYTIAKSMNLSIEEIDEVFTVLENLETRPGNAFDNGQITYVVPDVIAYRDANKWTATLNEYTVSNIAVKVPDAEMMHRATKDDRAFLKEKLKNARVFANGIRQRNRMLLECSKQIVHTQQEFFKLGEKQLNPLRLSDIAISIGCHESTVSRISRNKFLQTPRGTYELKYFFSKPLKTSSGGYVSSRSIQQYIKEWTRDENPLHPLSDSAIVKKFNNLDIKLARRTIAKYRQNMGIPASNNRKP